MKVDCADKSALRFLFRIFQHLIFGGASNQSGSQQSSATTAKTLQEKLKRN